MHKNCSLYIHWSQVDQQHITYSEIDFMSDILMYNFSCKINLHSNNFLLIDCFYQIYSRKKTAVSKTYCNMSDQSFCMAYLSCKETWIEQAVINEHDIEMKYKPIQNFKTFTYLFIFQSKSPAVQIKWDMYLFTFLYFS